MDILVSQKDASTNPKYGCVIRAFGLDPPLALLLLGCFWFLSLYVFYINTLLQDGVQCWGNSLKFFCDCLP